MNIKDWLTLTMFITIVLSVIVGFSEVYSYFSLGGEGDSLVWVGILSGITSLSLAIQELETTVEYLRESVESNSDNQKITHEKLNSIEDTLKKHQPEPITFNFLPLVINRKNKNDQD